MIKKPRMYVLGFFLALFLVFNLPKTTYAKAYVYKPDDTQPYYILDRGFTGHQHLDAFNLVDMKGRVYDPYVQIFRNLQ